MPGWSHTPNQCLLESVAQPTFYIADVRNFDDVIYCRYEYHLAAANATAGFEDRELVLNGKLLATVHKSRRSLKHSR